MNFREARGFTLIELLIVIGVLGILAAGLLAAVDPFEQLKKGRDSNVRNQVVELHNSNIRYYATHGDLPWEDGSCTWPGGAGTSQTLEALNTAGCITPIIGDGELKADFITAIGNDISNMYITSPNEVSLYICFTPGSKSVYADSATRYNISGTEDAGNCTTTKGLPGVAPLCYWCAK